MSSYEAGSFQENVTGDFERPAAPGEGPRVPGAADGAAVDGSEGSDEDFVFEDPPANWMHPDRARLLAKLNPSTRAMNRANDVWVPSGPMSATSSWNAGQSSVQRNVSGRSFSSDVWVAGGGSGSLRPPTTENGLPSAPPEIAQAMIDASAPAVVGKGLEPLTDRLNRERKMRGEVGDQLKEHRTAIDDLERRLAEHRAQAERADKMAKALDERIELLVQQMEMQRLTRASNFCDIPASIHAVFPHMGTAELCEEAGERMATPRISYLSSAALHFRTFDVEANFALLQHLAPTLKLSKSELVRQSRSESCMFLPEVGDCMNIACPYDHGPDENDHLLRCIAWLLRPISEAYMQLRSLKHSKKTTTPKIVKDCSTLETFLDYVASRAAGIMDGRTASPERNLEALYVECAAKIVSHRLQSIQPPKAGQAPEIVAPRRTIGELFPAGSISDSVVSGLRREGSMLSALEAASRADADTDLSLWAAEAAKATFPYEPRVHYARGMLALRQYIKEEARRDQEPESAADQCSPATNFDAVFKDCITAFDAIASRDLGPKLAVPETTADRGSTDVMNWAALFILECVHRLAKHNSLDLALRLLNNVTNLGTAILSPVAFFNLHILYMVLLLGGSCPEDFLELTAAVAVFDYKGFTDGNRQTQNESRQRQCINILNNAAAWLKPITTALAAKGDCVLEVDELNAAYALSRMNFDQFGTCTDYTCLTHEQVAQYMVGHPEVVPAMLIATLKPLLGSPTSQEEMSHRVLRFLNPKSKAPPSPTSVLLLWLFLQEHLQFDLAGAVAMKAIPLLVNKTPQPETVLNDLQPCLQAFVTRGLATPSTYDMSKAFVAALMAATLCPKDQRVLQFLTAVTTVPPGGSPVGLGYFYGSLLLKEKFLLSSRTLNTQQSQAVRSDCEKILLRLFYSTFAVEMKEEPSLATGIAL